MKGKRKTPKVKSWMRAVLARNVQQLMDYHFKDSTNKPKSLSAKAGISLSSVQRILSQEVGASLDHIQAVASVFDLSVYQLLLPEIDVANPQVIKGALKSEEAVYRRWQRGEFAPIEQLNALAETE